MKKVQILLTMLLGLSILLAGCTPQEELPSAPQESPQEGNVPQETTTPPQEELPNSQEQGIVVGDDTGNQEELS